MKILHKRLTLTPEVAAFATALLLVLAYNRPLWQRLVSDIHPANLLDWLFTTSWVLFLTGFINFFIAPLAHSRIIKPLIATLLLIASGVFYFMSEYGVVIDQGMVQNLVETDSAEAGEYFTTALVANLALFGILPVLMLKFIVIKPRPAGRQWLANLGSMGISLALISFVSVCFFPNYASLFRNDRELRLFANPTSAIYSFGQFLKNKEHHPTDLKVAPVGEDAHKAAQWQSHQRSTLAVIVVGETARAQNFSLNGYDRETNPLLARQDIINFSQVFSCGTATAKSLPCMLSPFGKDDYSDEKGKTTESVLDVIQRAGVDVVWRDNNSGCKGTCDRIERENLAHLHLDGLCNDEECQDEVLLNNFKALVTRHSGDLTVVLHQKGSHGPAYYQRVPKRFERFTPACHSSMLSSCTDEEIRNAYDNTILYTDWVLNATINLLKTEFTDRDTALIYVSDHGESLGEHNIYLHGAPDFIAPEEQTHVPMIAWLSDNYSADFAVNSQCLQGQGQSPISHDHLFHSILGMLRVETAVYDERLDIFSHCHSTTAVAHETRRLNADETPS